MSHYITIKIGWGQIGPMDLSFHSIVEHKVQNQYFGMLLCYTMVTIPNLNNIYIASVNLEQQKLAIL